MKKKIDFAGKLIPLHADWENSFQDEELDKSKHPKEGSKEDKEADEKARKEHNKKVKEAELKKNK